MKIRGTESQRRDGLLVEKKVLDAVREEEAGGSVEATPPQTSANTEPTELRQRAGTWTGRGRDGGWCCYAFWC